MTDNGFENALESSTNGNGHSVIDYIDTTDEEGEKHRFQLVDHIEVEGKEYGLLVYLGNPDNPVEPTDDDELVLMRISEEDGAQVFESIEDDEEFNKVLAVIEEMDDEEEEEEDAE